MAKHHTSHSGNANGSKEKRSAVERLTDQIIRVSTKALGKTGSLTERAAWARGSGKGDLRPETAN